MMGKIQLPCVINDYVFLQQIGQGGFAEVFLCTYGKYQRHFVAKVVRVDVEDMKSHGAVYDAEINALSELIHPNIIRLYDHFVHRNSYVLILEYCSRGSLADEIAANNGLEMSRFIQVATQLVQALLYCHENGIAHRDIKASNVLMDEVWQSKLADFGLSMHLENESQLTRKYSGSIQYTAPEIFRKRPHSPMCGDVWALGVLFAHMIGGKSPFLCESLGSLKKLASKGTYRLDSRTPPEVRDIIAQMIVVDPAGRITMKQLAENPLFNGGCVQPPRRRMRQLRKGASRMTQSQSFMVMKKVDECEDPAGNETRIANSMSIASMATLAVQVRPRVGGRAPRQMTFLATDDDVEECA